MLVSASDLTVGRIYFSLAYEDERLTRLFINSMEYIGVAEDADAENPAYLFRFIGRTGDQESQPGSGDELVAKETQLDLVYSFESLAEELVRLAPRNGAWSYDDVNS